MHTLSSAKRTWSAFLSAAEWTLTVVMPSSRQGRMMRNAISPRVAVRSFFMVASLRDLEQRLPVLHGLRVLHQHGGDDALDLRLELVHELHRLDDAQDLALLHPLADLDERRRVGARRPIERADERRSDGEVLAVLGGLGLGGGARRGGGGGRRRAGAGPGGSGARGGGGAGHGARRGA